MWKLLLIVIVALCYWLYLNPSFLNTQTQNLNQKAVNAFKQEKTVKIINNADNQVKNENKSLSGNP